MIKEKREFILAFCLGLGLLFRYSIDSIFCFRFNPIRWIDTFAGNLKKSR